MPVLDTNFLIALHANDAAAIALLDEVRDQRLIVPDVVAAELLTIWNDEDVREQMLAALRSDFTMASTGPEWVLAAASLWGELRRKRRKVRTPDVWIAAWARMLDEPVITRDERDFRGMAPIISW